MERKSYEDLLKTLVNCMEMLNDLNLKPVQRQLMREIMDEIRQETKRRGRWEEIWEEAVSQLD